MKNIEQIYTNCLAQGAYFIESEGEAAVIDPLRETTPYIQRSIDKNVKIKYIFETHFHADFVSGHIDLAEKTGAIIVYGPNADTNFDKHNAQDGEEFKVGKLTIKAIHTPGHTTESTCYLLLNEDGEEHAIFTGDTLFIGDVGRPDLAQKSDELSKEDLAGMLYDSLRNKILPLPDHVIIYPAHGAGSACGKNMSTETWDSLGNQKKINYALRPNMSKSEFIDELIADLLPPPLYFSKNAALNKKGYDKFDNVMDTGLVGASVSKLKEYQHDKTVLILDVRPRKVFVKGFIPGSLYIGLDGSFAPWVGALISDIQQKIVIVAEPGKEEEAVRRLARVGYDNSIGYLIGGFEAWLNADEPVDIIKTISVDEFINSHKQIKDETGVSILDVRNLNEYNTSHIQSAKRMSLDDFHNEEFKSIINSDNLNYVHCRSGFRSTIASSILFRNGIKNLVNVIGSFNLIKESGIQIEGTCPSLTMTHTS